MPARCRDSIKPLEESTFSASRKAVREAAWTAPPPRCNRGFGAIYAQHVIQADQDCDFVILRDGEAVPEPVIH